MSESDPTQDHGRGEAGSELPSDHPANGYRFVLVEYPDRPDECTIHPRSLDPQELLTTWITTGRSTVVDLDGMR